jgi:hypothetical protein
MGIARPLAACGPGSGARVSVSLCRCPELRPPPVDARDVPHAAGPAAVAVDLQALAIPRSPSTRCRIVLEFEVYVREAYIVRVFEEETVGLRRSTLVVAVRAGDIALGSRAIVTGPQTAYLRARGHSVRGALRVAFVAADRGVAVAGKRARRVVRPRRDHHFHILKADVGCTCTIMRAEAKVRKYAASRGLSISITMPYRQSVRTAGHHSQIEP